MPRRILALAAAFAFVFGLAGCTAEPRTDQEAIDVWLAGTAAPYAGRDDVQGALSAPISDDPKGASVTLGYDRTTRIDGFEVACTSGGAVEIGWELRSGSSYSTGGEVVDCTDASTRIELESPIEAVDEITVSAVRAAGSPGAVHVAIIGESVDAAADEWTGYFDDRSAQLGANSSASWGTFGAPGEIAVAMSTDVSLAPGNHRVSVECAGASRVTVSLIPGPDGTAAPEDVVTEELACPGGVSLGLTTGVEGLTVSVDSHGEPGAFLYAVDPAT